MSRKALATHLDAASLEDDAHCPTVDSELGSQLVDRRPRLVAVKELPGLISIELSCGATFRRCGRCGAGFLGLGSRPGVVVAGYAENWYQQVRPSDGDAGDEGFALVRGAAGDDLGTQRPSGSWPAVVYAGTDPLTGKEQRLRETGQTYDEAKKLLTKLQA